MKNKFYKFMMLLLISVGGAQAQPESTMIFMGSLPQVVYSNPAIVPVYKISVGLPGSSIMAFYSNNGFTYNNAIKHERDSIKADLSKLYKVLKPKNYITQALQVDLFRLSLRVNSKVYVTVNSTAKVYNRLMIPKDLVGIFNNGNASFIGQTATLSPKAESISYIETALGGSYKVDERLTVGVRLKFLKGITNLTTKSASLNLTTDNSNYALTAAAAMDVRTSGIYNFTQSGFDFGSNYKNYLRNNGLGVDIGATYQVVDNFTLGASLVDIGAIHWKNNTYGYSLDRAVATYTFEGVDLNKVIDGNSSYLNSLGDTLQNKFKIKDGTIRAYNSPLPGKMYLTGAYTMPGNFTIGAMLFSELYRGRLAPGLTLGVSRNLGRVISATGSYSITSNSFKNIGAGVSLNLIPIQLYVVGDNLLSIALSGKELSHFTNNTKFFNVRAGLNFIFGRVKGKDKQKSMDAGNPIDQAGDSRGIIKRKVYKNYTPDKVRKR